MMQEKSILPFTYIFRGHWGHDVFEGHDGATPRHAPVRSGAGADRVRKLNERERGVKRWSGSGRSRSGERGLQKEA